MSMSNPTWKDLQKLGCERIGYTINGTLLVQPVCAKCGQEYEWSRFFEEWVHPFEKEFDEFKRLNPE